MQSRRAGPPRASVTVTVPSWPVMVLTLFNEICVPSDTFPVGALIDSRPAAVSVNDIVSAAADSAVAAAKAAKALARSRNLRI